MEATDCGAELIATDSYQKLQSSPVKANDNCAWRIKAPAGQKVELSVDYISFPCTDSCSSYVEVKYRDSKTTTG